LPQLVPPRRRPSHIHASARRQSRSPISEGSESRSRATGSSTIGAPPIRRTDRRRSPVRIFGEEDGSRTSIRSGKLRAATGEWTPQDRRSSKSRRRSWHNPNFPPLLLRAKRRGKS
jgi:hypothetical protein